MWDRGFIQFCKEQGVNLTKHQKGVTIKIIDALMELRASGCKTVLLGLLVKFDNQGNLDHLQRVQQKEQS